MRKIKIIALFLLIFSFGFSEESSQEKSERITQLEQQIETQNKIIARYERLEDKLNDRVLETLDLNNKVDDFYNSAWNKLILVITGAFAGIGLLLPYLQNQNFKETKEKIKEQRDEIERYQEDSRAQKKELQKYQINLEAQKEGLNELVKISTNLYLKIAGEELDKIPKENYLKFSKGMVHNFLESVQACIADNDIETVSMNMQWINRIFRENKEYSDNDLIKEFSKIFNEKKAEKEFIVNNLERIFQNQKEYWETQSEYIEKIIKA